MKQGDGEAGSYLLGFLMLLKVDKAKASGVAAVIPHHLHTQRLPWEGPTWLKGEFRKPQGVALSSHKSPESPGGPFLPA